MAFTTLSQLQETISSLTADDLLVATPHIDLATAAIKEAAGSPIEQTSATITVAGDRDRRLVVPVSPLTAVSAVTLDGTAVTDWTLIGNSLWRDIGWRTLWGRPSNVAITCTFGYATVPGDIRVLCEHMVAAAIAQTTEDKTLGPAPGLQSERIGDYEYTLRPGADGDAMFVFDLPDRTRRRLRMKYGGGHASTRTL